MCGLQHAVGQPYTPPTQYTILWNFEGGDSSGFDGSSPLGNVVIDHNAGQLYGTTFGGGTNGTGTLYKMQIDGSAYSSFISFGEPPNYDEGPMAPPLMVTNLSGVGITPPLLIGTANGGQNFGSIYMYDQQRNQYSTAFSFLTNGPDGVNPECSLVLVSNSVFGTTAYGDGDPTTGSVFGLTNIFYNGAGYSSGFDILHDFVAPDSQSSGLTLGDSNVLYGVTREPAAGGTIYKINPDGSGFQTLYNFTNDGFPFNTWPSKLLYSKGVLYGAIEGLQPQDTDSGFSYGGIVYKINTDGSGFTVLNWIPGQAIEGGPVALFGDRLFGTASGFNDGTGQGIVYQIKTDGTDSEIVYHFGSVENDGNMGNELSDPLAIWENSPYSAVLYGTTEYGGSYNNGTVYALPVTLPPTLTFSNITSTNFTFSAVGQAGSSWTIYSSYDLSNWTSIGTMNINSNGFSSYTGGAIENTMYKFYKVSNGTFTSDAIGFERVAVIGSGTNVITDQLIQSIGTNNTLASAFNATVTLNDLPNGTKVQKWNGSGVNTYTYSGGSWNDGTPTLNPGEGVFLINPTNLPLVATFVGLVPEGQLLISLTNGGDFFVGSMVPKSGGIQSVLEYNPQFGDQLFQWTNGGWNLYYFYDTTVTPPTWEDLDGDPVPEPEIGVGEGFLFLPNNNETWTNFYSPVGGSVPALSQGQLIGNNFSFNITGDASLANAYWEVYGSTDLQNWNDLGQVQLDSSATAIYTNSGLTLPGAQFYKLKNETSLNTSEAIGFEQYTIPGVTNGLPSSTNLIADQLIQTEGSDNALASAFVQTTLLNASQFWKYNGSGYDIYTYSSSSGSWSGNTTFNPGEGAFFVNPSTNSRTMTFTGIIPEGRSFIPLLGGKNKFASSMLPETGGIQSVLGFNPIVDTEVLQWQNSQYLVTLYDNTQGTNVWYDGDDVTPMSEPVLNLGDAVVLVPGWSFFWFQTFNP